LTPESGLKEAMVKNGRLLGYFTLAALTGFSLTYRAEGAKRNADSSKRVIRIDKSFSAGDIESVNADVKMGNIRLFADSPDRIVVKTLRTFDGAAVPTISTDKESETVQFRRNGSALTIEDRPPRMEGPAKSKKTSYRFEAEIHLPPRLRVDAETGMGNVEAEGVFGDLHAESGMGNVRAPRISGSGNSIRLESGMGNVEAGLSDLPKSRLEAETGMGNVRISLPSNARATLDLESGMGRVACEFPIPSPPKDRFEIGGERHGDLNGGGTRVKASSGMGNVLIARSGR
jgi:hypothetical protein